MKFTETDIPGKGRGLVAVEDIKKGELLIKEKRIIRGLGRGMAISSILRAFILREIANPSDRAAFISLYDPDPSGPLDMKEARIYQSNAFADGVFLTCSKMNHSCKPAVQMSSDDEIETEVRALRDIKVGEEITVSYLRSSALRTKEERIEELKPWEEEPDPPYN